MHHRGRTLKISCTIVKKITQLKNTSGKQRESLMTDRLIVLFIHYISKDSDVNNYCTKESLYTQPYTTFSHSAFLIELEQKVWNRIPSRCLTKQIIYGTNFYLKLIVRHMGRFAVKILFVHSLTSSKAHDSIDRKSISQISSKHKIEK